ncbi:MAG: PTS sugar transporter subunit IIA [Erysipelotrichaceae bacterium]|nr:PTS sugar transporter subunit IIA [Erysipelotrichaceae bacterium]MBQ4252533.1 PTS sugar transporter subunit IIA [Erysipelotrichaceae bacterium]
MPLIDILNPDIIDLEVKGNTKDEVLRYMARDLYDNGYINDVDQFVSDIYVREAEGPTGMGSHISIPHGKSESVQKIGICIGRTLNPVKWETGMTEDGWQDTRLIFLFCVSADAEFATNHMMLLSELAGKLGNDARVARLADATTKQEVIDLILCDESELEGTELKETEEIIDLDIDF